MVIPAGLGMLEEFLQMSPIYILKFGLCDIQEEVLKVGLTQEKYLDTAFIAVDCNLCNSGSIPAVGIIHRRAVGSVSWRWMEISKSPSFIDKQSMPAVMVFSA